MFKHYAAHRPKYQPRIAWTPPNWDPKEPPLEIYIERVGADNPRFVKAAHSKKNPFPKKRRDGVATPAMVRQRRNAMLKLAIMAVVVDWKGVIDDTGKEVPFPSLSTDDPGAPGNKLVGDLFGALGVESTDDFINFVNNDDNWLEVPADDEEAAEGDVPLGSKSQPG
jgi:hypothetical protein